MQEISTLKTIGKYSYYTSQCLGHGSFGKVYEGFETTTKTRIAIKKVDFKLFEKDSYLQQSLLSEIKIMDKLKHPNVVELYQVLHSKRSIYIVMEFCGGGDLKKYLKSKGRVPVEQALSIMKQIACGFSQLTRHRIIHRDLKPANILISDGAYKLCDFGFAKYVDSAEELLKSCVGSPLYMAPQILERQKYTYKCDVWSFGVIFFQLLHGSPPWRAPNQVDLLKNIKAIPLQLADCFEAELAQFVKTLLVISEEKRAGWQEIFQYFGVKQQGKEETVPTAVVPVVQPTPLTVVPPQQQQIAQPIPQPISEPKARTQLPAQVFVSYIPSMLLARNPSPDWRPYSPRPIASPLITTKEDSYFGLTSNFLQQLAFRSFIACEVTANLRVLKHLNFSKNLFQKMIFLIRCSIKYRFHKLKSIIDILTDMAAVQLIRRQWAFEEAFLAGFLEEQANELKKDLEIKPILQKGVPKDMKAYQGIFRQLAITAIGELGQQVEQSEKADLKISLLLVMRNICDLFIANSHLTNGFDIAFGKIFTERSEQIQEADFSRFVDKMTQKVTEFQQINETSFFI